MTSPKVIIAAPVSHKILDGKPFFTGVDWLRSVLAQDYPDFSVYVLGNDLLPEMQAELADVANVVCKVKHTKINPVPDQRGVRKKKDKTYKRFALVRNMVLGYVLRTDADYYVSIDSDIIVHRDLVSRMVAQMEIRQEYGMIAAIVNNCRRKNCKLQSPRAIYNFGMQAALVKRKSKKEDEKRYVKIRKFPQGSFINDVGFTGACMIIRMDMLRKHRSIKWGAQKSGEDLFMCERIREHGYKIGVDTSIVTLHMMDDTVYKEDIGTFNDGKFI